MSSPLLSADATGVFYIFPQSKTLQLNFLIGLPLIWYMLDKFIVEYLTISCGVSLLIGHALKNGHILYLRMGAGIPFSFSDEGVRIGETIVPDIGIGINLKV